MRRTEQRLEECGGSSASATVVRWAWLIVAIILAGCQGDPPTLTPLAVDALAPLPTIAPTGLDSGSLEELRELRAALDEALSAGSPNPAELASRYGALGMRYHSLELIAAADAAYQNATALAPRSAQWPYYRARMWQENNDLDRAIVFYRQVLAIEPEYLAALVYQAEALHAAGEVEDAEVALATATSLQPDTAAALIIEARIAADRGQAERVVELLERALTLEPQASVIHYPLGIAFRELGQEDRAESHLAERGSVTPPLPDPFWEDYIATTASAQYHNTRGVAAIEAGAYEMAAEELRLAIAVDPERPSIHLNYAVALRHLGQLDAAKDALRDALAIESTHPGANFNLGVLLAREGQHAEAAEHYQRTLEGDPNHPGARFNLANTLMRLDRLEEASELYHSVVERQPSNLEARLLEASTLVELQDWPSALAALETSRQALPQSADIANALTRVLATCPLAIAGCRDAPRALDLANTLVAQESSASNLQARALALYAGGRSEEASEEQAALVSALEEMSQSAHAAAARWFLSEMEAGAPIEQPWAPQDPIRPQVAR